MPIIYSKPRKVTITFDTDGGTPATDPITVDPGTQWSAIKGQVNAPSKEGKVFTGWEVKPKQ